MDRATRQPPRLGTLDTDERSAIWTELFHDLVGAGAYLARSMVLASSSSGGSGAGGLINCRLNTLLRLGGAAAILLLGLLGGDVKPEAFGILLALIAMAEVALDIPERWLTLRNAPLEVIAVDGSHAS